MRFYNVCNFLCINFYPGSHINYKFSKHKSGAKAYASSFYFVVILLYKKVLINNSQFSLSLYANRGGRNLSFL